MKLPLIALLTLASFSAITEQLPSREFKRVVDNELRLQYYADCRKIKQNKDCHYSSFEKAIKLVAI